MLSIFSAVAVAYGVVAGGVYVFQRSILYQPFGGRPEFAPAAALGLGEATLRTEDGLDLLAWYRAAPAGAPTLVYYCGNAGHLGSRVGKIATMIAQGYGVLAVQYRGYGGNPGSPTESGLFADGHAALAFLAGQGIERERLVLYGESLGSAVAVRMAHEAAAEGRAMGAVVLEAPFTSVVDVARRRYPFLPVDWLAKDRFESVRVIDAIGAPLLVLHGTADRVVPAEFGRRLFAAAKDPKEFQGFEGGRHVDLFDHGAAEGMAGFLARHLGVR